MMLLQFGVWFHSLQYHKNIFCTDQLWFDIVCVYVGDITHLHSHEHAFMISDHVDATPATMK